MSPRIRSGPSQRPRRQVAAAVLGMVVLGASACSSAPAHKAAPTAHPTTPTTSTPAAPVTNPLTGTGPVPSGPVVAVKIDDTAASRPSVALDKADVIYVEQAEGGVSRMVAVFASHKPVVGSVRSVRASDPELLWQYGRIILVASGGGGDALPTLDRSIMHAVINDRGGPGFSRSRSHPAPYNLLSDLAEVSRKVKADGVRNVGFTFSAADPRLASAPKVTAPRTVVGSTPVTFLWNGQTYIRTVNGMRLHAADGAPIAKSNVLVQYCTVTVNHGDVDVLGNPSQYTHTIGTGKVVLYRDGKQIVGRWSRPSAGAATTYTDAAGKPLTFAPGGLFVALVKA
ncbi:DUF3048 domain-containing protein [Oryzihumus leptocrescens]|uniref:DUF3048 family protein n=1 Tax=Oryzihumus leptocrescens TaxID=297536 RepID=A0A542ZEX0_9MICO|nr:DUF3048 domain-containing protein [Oryzihumus leptocrescens]TQL58874.1 DUF3048 family protein [Oryzihumus leptocrescens]